jgi:hypothetical protein
VACLAIGREVHLDDTAGLGQELRQRLCGGVSAQIPDEDARWNGCLLGSSPVGVDQPAPSELASNPRAERPEPPRLP